MIVFKPVQSTIEEFVNFWDPQYPRKDDVKDYDPVIGLKPLTVERLKSLFGWKAGKRFKVNSDKFVDKIADQLSEINSLPLDYDAHEFLDRFGKTSAIWAIFLLHCWQPAKYPIYDQNVYRAMLYITSQPNVDFAKWSNDRKIASYFDVYLSFYKQFEHYDHRTADRALFMCGKFLKTTAFPEIVKWRNANSARAPGSAGEK